MHHAGTRPHEHHFYSRHIKNITGLIQHLTRENEKKNYCVK